MNAKHVSSSRLLVGSTLAFLGIGLFGQDSSSLDIQTLRQAISSEKEKGPAEEVVPKSTPNSRLDRFDDQMRVKTEREKANAEIRAARALEKGPTRFAADLFQFRDPMSSGTEGGISEDYVLGIGDQLQLNAFGSVTFELPTRVDGRGEVLIPKVGTVKVSGLSLNKARTAIQSKVAQNFSRTSVDVSVVKLREVRIFVLGEVYKPGSYLVPSLSSLVNVLSMAGGPTASGSYRQIRILRGGKVVHTVDLYPLRAEGLGNMNFSLQTGDTVFVPLAYNQVLLEGAFTRVVASAKASGDSQDDLDVASEPEELRQLKRQVHLLEARVETRSESLTAVERGALEERLLLLKDQLREMKLKSRGDQRIQDSDPRRLDETQDQPEWLLRWQLEGKAPLLQFEMLPGETVADALHFAGGLELRAFSEGLSLRRLDAMGAINAMDVSLNGSEKKIVLQRGDTLSALPRRDWAGRAVQIVGWVRVPGYYARTENLRVGDILQRESQILSDTYLGRGEIIRTLANGTTHYLAFDVSKALSGDPDHNLLLENRDRIELYRLDDFRIRRTLSVVGPVSKPGTYEFHEGMRASDLLFRAGIPLRQADRYVAELAHTMDGKPSVIRRLDLTKLLSSDTSSPMDLQDDAVNPRLEPFDQLSVYAKPDYKAHRTITLSGQVVRPGIYTLDSDHATLKDIVERAGGLTPEAMPTAGIFLRQMGNVDREKAKAAQLSGVEASDPTAQGINEILGRLAETKRQTTTGILLKNPVLHGLQTGSLTRLVVNIPALLEGDPKAQVEFQDGDEVIIPRRTEAAYVVGETASPFAVYKVQQGMKVKDMLRLAGGTTRNADTWNIRLLKADGRIIDSWVSGRKVEPGDTVLVPQRIRRDTNWQENLQALTPLALILNAIK